MFIAIDGPNGVGKSTVITELFKQLKEKHSGYQIIVITEPSKTIIGDSIRQFSENKIHNTTLLSLVAADREYNHVEYIRPLLENKKVILNAAQAPANKWPAWETLKRNHGVTDWDTFIGS